MERRKKRQSGIELLRILSILCVIILHYNDGKAFLFVAENSPHKYVLFFLESISICAVDLFIIISGYFLSSKQNRSMLKLADLYFQFVSVKLIKHIVFIILGKSSFSISVVFDIFIPRNYFFILYCAMYLVSPYVNIVLRKLKHDMWTFFLLIIICVFSIWNTVVDLIEEIIGQELSSLSTISKWGSLQGFNIVNFLLAYILGGWIRYGEMPNFLRRNKTKVLLWICTVIAIFFWAMLCEKMNLTELRSAWVYHNPLVLSSAILLFLLFKDLDYTNAVINRIASASFMCFLIHNSILPYVQIEQATKSNVFFMLLHIIVVLAGCYIISWIAFEIYHLLSKGIISKLSKYRIFRDWKVDI